MKYVITVTLNPALDQSAEVASHRLCYEHPLKRHMFSAGGKGINAARTLEHLGVSTLSTGFIGGHTGKFLRLLLNEDGLKESFIDITANTRTNVSIIDQNLNGRMTRYKDLGS